MNKRPVLCGVLAACVIALVLWNPNAEAIPAFARKYETSCVTCHVAYPKLTAFGEAFRRNGFQFPEGTDLDYIKETPVELGSEAYKRVFPKAVWPGQIPGTAPFAARFEGSFDVTPNADAEATTDLRIPASMTLLTSGTLGEDLAFYADIHLFDHGELGFLNRAFFQFSNLLDSSLPYNALNLKVGQFTIAADPFAGHRDELTMTPLSVAVYQPGLGASLEAGHHGSSGTLELTQRGLEIDGVLSHHFTYALGVVNGNGIGTANHDTLDFDNNSMKDFYGRLAYKIGGMGFDGHTGKSDEETSLNRSKGWIDDSLRIGVFAYLGDPSADEMETHEDDHDHAAAPSLLNIPLHGDEDHSDEEPDAGGEMPGMEDQPVVVTSIQRIGVDLNLYYRNLNLFGAVMLTKNDLDGTDADPSALVWFVQGDYVFYPWLIGALRYDMVLFDSGATNAETESAKRLVPHLTALFRPNIKFTLESAIDLDDTDRFTVMTGLDYAF